jgi:hypothetical protein
VLSRIWLGVSDMLWRMARIAHVSKLRRVLETWRINTIIDVGANDPAASIEGRGFPTKRADGEVADATKRFRAISRFGHDRVVEARHINRGQFRDFLRVEVGFSGQIHSVEPISTLAKEM